MTPNYYVTTGATAKFIGTPSMVWWTGPGDPKLEASIATQLGLGNLIQVDLTGVGQFADSILMNDLPTGDALHQWTGDEFANAAQIKARPAGAGADQKARDAVEVLSKLLGDVTADIADVKAKLVQAGSG